MKKYNLSNIMKKAWEIFRNSDMSFADALRRSWGIAKGLISEKPAKKPFTGRLNYYGFDFKLWENYGKHRIYITNNSGSNKRNSGGFIDLDNGNAIRATGCVKGAAMQFMMEYDISATASEKNELELAV